MEFKGQAISWQIVDGAFVGGSLTENVPHNEFLSISKNGRTAVVHYGNDGIAVVDVLMITAADLGSPRRGKKAA